jgi:GWxTD domain-containing protein
MAAAAAVLLLTGGCALSRLEKSLDPDSREFLSKVRYIISRDERRVLANLPESERKPFIEEFWKKRDPKPETEENEFKIEYFRRIEWANRLFSGGGSPGWLQDRGRIYILLGPPDQRYTYPRGVTFYGKPMEFWQYGFFQIAFIDDSWTGSYRLDPDNPEQLAEIMRAQMEWKPQVSVDQTTGAKVSLDCTLNVTIEGPGKALARILVPYKEIWGKASPSDPTLRTTLAVSLEASDASGKKVWDFKKDYPVAMTEADMAKAAAGEFAIEIPVELASGSYILSLTLTNTVDNSTVRKRSPLKF